MLWRFNKVHLDKVLGSDSRLTKIINSPGNAVLACPYDNIVLYSNRDVSKDFWDIICPAKYCDRKMSSDERYKYLLAHELFIVTWGKRYTNLPNTIIKINPNRNNLTPSQLLDLIAYILGDFADVEVASWDEKVDLMSITPKEVAERLYVGYQRKRPRNRKNQDSTYYYGARRGQQVKVYNKAKQLKLIDKTLVRIEKTHKLHKGKRISIESFLLEDNQDVFKNVILTDINTLDGRTKVRRLIKSEGTLVTAYSMLSRREQQNLKQHQVFKSSSINLQKIIKQDINDWVATSPFLRLKVISSYMKAIFINNKREELRRTNFSSFQSGLSFNSIFPVDGWELNKTVTSSVSL